MSAKDQIKQIVDLFKRENYLKDKTNGMGDGLLLAGELADEANERSKEARLKAIEVDRKYTDQLLSNDLDPGKDPELVDIRNGNATAGERISKFEQDTNRSLEKNINDLSFLSSEVEIARGSETSLPSRLERDRNEIITSLANKMDKEGSGQVTYANLAQDIRLALTGGAVAVVGNDGVVTSNITKNAVTADKISSSNLATSVNILDLGMLMDGKYYGGQYSQSTGSKVMIKEVPVWNGSVTPIKVKAGDVVRYNQAIYGEYFIGVDDDLIIRQYGATKDILSASSVTVQTGVTGFFAAVRDEHLSTTMITINNPMPSTYVPNKIPSRKKLDWLEVDFENFSEPVRNELGGLSHFAGKEANFIGDSITNGQYLYSQSLAWPSIVGEKLNLGKVNNYGINGSSVSAFGSNPMVSRYSSMSASADVIFFMGGRNDFASSTDAFGDINTPASQTNTFYGALKNIAEGLKIKYPGKLIILCTPPHGSSASIPENRANPTTGKIYSDYVQAIRNVANYYSLPVCDLWNTAGMQPLVGIDNETYFRHDASTMDGVHPNKVGHERIAERVAGCTRNLVP